MNMTKRHKTFRLSERALENLQTVKSFSGASETAIIELALAHYVMVVKAPPAPPAPPAQIVTSVTNPPEKVNKPPSFHKPHRKSRRRF